MVTVLFRTDDQAAIGRWRHHGPALGADRSHQKQQITPQSSGLAVRSGTGFNRLGLWRAVPEFSQLPPAAWQPEDSAADGAVQEPLLHRKVARKSDGAWPPDGVHRG